MSTDGRVARGLRTRAAVIDAMLDLVAEGDLRPTGPAIAERAGVSLRSVFQHFTDMESLFLAAATRHAQRVGHLYDDPLPAGPVESRVHAFTRRRSRIWEAVTPVRRAARLAAPQSPQVTQLLDAARELHRQEAMNVFGDMDLPPEVVEAVDLLFSWDTWDSLRSQRDLSVEQACAVVETAVRAILQAVRVE